MKFEHAADFTGGTCLQGYITFNYDQLVSCFGEPTCEGDAYKVQAEWCLRFEDGMIATIYDWKEGDAYCGLGEGKPVHAVTDWHIGGHDPRAVDRVLEFLVVGR